MFCPNCEKDVEELCVICGWVGENGHDDCFSSIVSHEINELEKMFQYVGSELTIVVSGATHIGKIKNANEDYHLYLTLDSLAHKISTTIIVVADGIGGGVGGQAMAILAVLETVKSLVFSIESHEKESFYSREEFWQKVNDQISQDLVFPLRSANKLDCAYAQKQGFSRYGGAAVCVSVVICDYLKGHVKIYGYNEGDVRCLLVKNNQIYGLLSVDHTHPVDHSLLSFFGKGQDINGAFFEPVDFWFPENALDSLSLLVYSDGLHSMLSEDTLVDFLELPLVDLVDLAIDVSEPAAKLFDSRVQSGDDNVTVVKLEIRKRRI